MAEETRVLAVCKGNPPRLMCDDCGAPLGDTFCGDMDGRVFHRGHCGGAEYAQRMSTVRGTPEYLRMVEAELELLKTSCIVEVAVRNPQVAEYVKHWESRAQKAEAELAKARAGKGPSAGTPDYPAILERERSLVAQGVSAIKGVLRGRDWLTEGRGPYHWDDDNWHKEFAAAIEEIKQALEPLVKVAGDLSNCPTDWKEIQRARSECVAGADELSLSDRINALPEWARQFIHDIETKCDPAGDIRTIAELRDTIRALEARAPSSVREQPPQKPNPTHDRHGN